MHSARFPRRRSIRSQLLLTYVFALLLAAVVAALLLAIQFFWRTEAFTTKGLGLQADWIEEGLLIDANGRPAELDPTRNSPWIYESIPDDLKYAVLDSGGNLLSASKGNGGALAPVGVAMAELPKVLRLTVDGIVMDVLTRPIRKNGNTYFIQVARSTRLDHLVKQAIGWPMLKTAISVGAGSLLLLIIVAYLSLRRSLKPLHEASEAAARIEPGNLSKRLDTTDVPAELIPLVEAFNMALDRLERGYRVQQEFLAGAAHELKTPLALIRAQIERDGATRNAALLNDVDMMARQVHQLLHLAEMSEAHNYVVEPIALGDLASEVSSYLERLADMKQVCLEVRNAMPKEKMVHGDRSATFVLLKNLVENAIRHSPSGGVVRIGIEDDYMYVRDHGAGIAEHDMPKLYTRFWRGPGRRDDGAGLGLAICQQIALTHGWTIEAANAGQGARFTVRFSSDVAPVSRQ